MTRYFLHLRDGDDEILDPEGSEFAMHADLESALLTAAREIIAAEVLRGEVNLNQRIDAEDAEGRRAYSLTFRDALTIVGL
jgi:hypothetical protein